MNWAAKERPLQLAVSMMQPTMLRGVMQAMNGVTPEEWDNFQRMTQRGTNPNALGRAMDVFPAESSKYYVPFGWRNGTQKVVDVSNWFPTNQVNLKQVFTGNPLVQAAASFMSQGPLDSPDEALGRSAGKMVPAIAKQAYTDVYRRGMLQTQPDRYEPLTEPTGNIPKDVAAGVVGLARPFKVQSEEGVQKKVEVAEKSLAAKAKTQSRTTTEHRRPDLTPEEVRQKKDESRDILDFLRGRK
jgi:hypothetical protein